MEIAVTHGDPAISKLLFNNNNPPLALPPASQPGQTPAPPRYAEPVRYATPEHYTASHVHSGYADVPGYGNSYQPQQPSHQPIQPPAHSNPYTSQQIESRYNNPEFHSVSEPITTPNPSDIYRGGYADSFNSYNPNLSETAAIVPYVKSNLAVTQTESKPARGLWTQLCDLLDWSLYRYPKLFWILLSFLGLFLVAGVITSPLLVNKLPWQQNQKIQTPAPSPTPTPGNSPKPTPSATPAPPPAAPKPAPVAPGTGTPPNEPPSL
jgi:hypothetical protein